MKYVFSAIFSVFFTQFTKAQTLKLYEVYDTTVYTPQAVYSHNSALYFTALNKTNGKMVLFKSNHSGAKADSLLSSPSSLMLYTVHPTILYIAALDSASKTVLYRSNGTISGTTVLKNIGFLNLQYPHYDPPTGTVYFATYNQTKGEICLTDGTPQGTHLISDTYPQNFQSFTSYKGEVYAVSVGYIRANTGVISLLRIEKNRTPTLLYAHCYNGNARMNEEKYGLTVFKDKMYYGASITSPSNPSGPCEVELMVSDGTVQGTKPYNNLCSGCNTFPNNFHLFNNYLYMDATANERFFNLFRVDGLGGMLPIGNSTNFSATFSPREIITHKNEMYMVGGTYLDNFALYRSKGEFGVTDAVVKIKDMPHKQTLTPTGPTGLVSDGKNIFFVAISDSLKEQVYITDGTNAGTRPIIPAEKKYQNPAGDIFGRSLTVIGDYIYLTAWYSNKQHLWRINTNTTPTADIGKNKDIALSVKLYPNPTSDFLTLETEQPVNYTLYNALGQSLLSGRSSDNVKLNIQSLNKGLYFLECRDGWHKHTQKVVKN